MKKQWIYAILIIIASCAKHNFKNIDRVQSEQIINAKRYNFQKRYYPEKNSSLFEDKNDTTQSSQISNTESASLVPFTKAKYQLIPTLLEKPRQNVTARKNKGSENSLQTTKPSSTLIAQNDPSLKNDLLVNQSNKEKLDAIFTEELNQEPMKDFKPRSKSSFEEINFSNTSDPQETLKNIIALKQDQDFIQNENFIDTPFPNQDKNLLTTAKNIQNDTQKVVVLGQFSTQDAASKVANLISKANDDDFTVQQENGKYMIVSRGKTKENAYETAHLLLQLGYYDVEVRSI